MKKRALCLSGGGSKGAFQVGALKALTEAGHTWHSVHGISVGALNASWISMFPPEKQKENIVGLYEIWNNVKSTKDILSKWSVIKPVNYLMSMWKGSLNSGKPLRKLIEQFFDSEKLKNSGVKLTVGCVNLNTSEYESINGDNPLIKEFILASSHLPLVFEPLEINGQKWVDGGIRHQIPFLDALKERPDEIDVILTSPIRTADRISNCDLLTSAPRVALRSSEIMSDHIYVMDCYTVLRAAKTLDNIKVNIFSPSVQPNSDSMNFDEKLIKAGIEMGYVETKAKLSKVEEMQLDDSYNI